MTDKRLPPDRPEAWLAHARSDLVIAGTPIPGAYLEDLCYHAQQAAEKAFKAVLLHRSGQFPYVHDLSELLNRIRQAGIVVPDEIAAAASLTGYAVESRYPGFDIEVSDLSWNEAIRLAHLVIDWAAAVIAEPV